VSAGGPDVAGPEQGGEAGGLPPGAGATASGPAAGAPGGGGGVIGRLIELCARQRGLTVLLVLAAALFGARAVRETPLDALPDLSDVQVIVFTEWPGRGPELVEDQVTYPVSARLLSTPGVRYVRGESYFGLSSVSAIF